MGINNIYIPISLIEEIKYETNLFTSKIFIKFKTENELRKYYKQITEELLNLEKINITFNNKNFILNNISFYLIFEQKTIIFLTERME